MGDDPYPGAYQERNEVVLSPSRIPCLLQAEARKSLGSIAKPADTQCSRIVRETLLVCDSCCGGLKPKAPAVKGEAVAQRIAIKPVVGGIVTSNAVLVARSIV
jgi:hypothetical protein